MLDKSLVTLMTCVHMYETHVYETYMYIEYMYMQ